MTTTTTAPTFSEAGAARLTIADEVSSAEQWRERWQLPTFALGEFGNCWASAPTWRVSDFPAELGFFVDGLGFDVNALVPSMRDSGASYAMLVSPDRQVTFAIESAGDERPAVAPGSLRLEFMLRDVRAAVSAAAARGITVLREPWQEDGDGGMVRASLSSPSGVEVSLWQEPASAR